MTPQTEIGSSQSQPVSGAVVGSEPSASWEVVATEVTEAVAAAIEPGVRKAADDIYSELLEAAQSYLADNMRFNIASRIGAADRQALSDRLALRNAEAQRDGLLTALQALLVAVTYAAPPKEYGTLDDPNPGYEARVPVEFVEDAERAIAKAVQS